MKIFGLKKLQWESSLAATRGRCNNKNHVEYHKYGAMGVECLLTTKQIQFLWDRDKAYKFGRPSLSRIDNKDSYNVYNCMFIELNTLSLTKGG